MFSPSSLLVYFCSDFNFHVGSCEKKHDVGLNEARRESSCELRCANVGFQSARDDTSGRIEKKQTLQYHNTGRPFVQISVFVTDRPAVCAVCKHQDYHMYDMETWQRGNAKHVRWINKNIVWTFPLLRAASTMLTINTVRVYVPSALGDVCCAPTFRVLFPAVGQQREDRHCCPQPSDKPPSPWHLLSNPTERSPGEKKKKKKRRDFFFSALTMCNAQIH